jgi:hypothetical protein
MQPSLSVRGFDRVVNSGVWNHLPRGNWTGINPGTGKQSHAATSSRAYKEGSLPVRTQQATPPPRPRTPRNNRTVASTLSSSSAPEATTTSRAPPPKLTCLCSPTNHPGSFRCSRHRGNPSGEGGQSRGGRAPHEQVTPGCLCFARSCALDSSASACASQ